MGGYSTRIGLCCRLIFCFAKLYQSAETPSSRCIGTIHSKLNYQIAMRNEVHVQAQFIEQVLGQFIGELIKESAYRGHRKF